MRAPAPQVRVWADEPPQVRGQAQEPPQAHEPSRVRGKAWPHEPLRVRVHEHEQWLRHEQAPWQLDGAPLEALLPAHELESELQRALRHAHAPPRELSRAPPHVRRHERSAALPPTLGVPSQAEVPPRVPPAWRLSQPSSCPCLPPTEPQPPLTEQPSPPQLLPLPRLIAQARLALRTLPLPQVPPRPVARRRAVADQ